MIAKFKKMSKKWSLLTAPVIALIAIIALTNAKSSSESNDGNVRNNDIAVSDSAETKTGTPSPMIYVGYSERKPQGYGGYSRSSDRPATRGKINKLEGDKADTGSTTGMGYGGYALGYGGYRAKDTEKSGSQDANSPTTEP